MSARSRSGPRSTTIALVPVRAYPPQPAPVLLVVVDEQAASGRAAHVLEPPQLRRGLRLVVHGAHDRSPSSTRSRRARDAAARPVTVASSPTCAVASRARRSPVVHAALHIRPPHRPPGRSPWKVPSRTCAVRACCSPAARALAWARQGRAPRRRPTARGPRRRRAAGGVRPRARSRTGRPALDAVVEPDPGGGPLAALAAGTTALRTPAVRRPSAPPRGRPPLRRTPPSALARGDPPDTTVSRSPRVSRSRCAPRYGVVAHATAAELVAVRGALAACAARVHAVGGGDETTWHASRAARTRSPTSTRPTDVERLGLEWPG